MDDEWYDDEVCYECSGYGDDYFINEDGELECRCSSCYVMRKNSDDDWWDD